MTSLQDGTAQEPTLSIRLVMATLETAQRLGIARARFLELAKFDPARLEIPEGRVPCSEYYRLCALLLELGGDPALGLHEAEVMTGVSFNIITPLVAYASTLRNGFETLFQVHRLLGDQLRYTLIEGEREVTLRCATPEGMSQPVRRFMSEFEQTCFFRMIGYFGGGARPERVSFEYAAPDYYHEYTRVFDGRERFEQPFTGVVFDRALMDVPSVLQDGEIYGVLRAQADHRIARIVQRACYARRVREVLVQAASGRTEMDAVARTLGLSVRSLRRRLAEEHTTYQAVASSALATIAKRHLLVEGRTIQETAHAMGYADSGAFHRAFKRWTGSTPNRFLTERER